MHQVINPSSYPSIRRFINHKIQPYSDLSKHPPCLPNIHPYNQPSSTIHPSIHRAMRVFHSSLQPSAHSNIKPSNQQSSNPLSHASQQPATHRASNQQSIEPCESSIVLSNPLPIRTSSHPTSNSARHLSFICLSSVPSIQLIIRPTIHQSIHASAHSSIGSAIQPVHSIKFVF